MIPGKPFDPATLTSRRPTPERFDHLRKWVEPIRRAISMTSITEITNITEQLEQSATFFIDNIISRVIAQVVGKFEDGFVTIEGTEDGALHVYIKDVDAAATIPVTLEAGTESIGTVGLDAGTELVGKVQIEGASHTVLRAVINFATAATHEIIAAVAAVRHHITSIVLTVGGETNLTLKRAAAGMSGAMDFGGTNEPRGMVSNHGNWPLICGTNEAFQITSSAAVQVSGYVIYYDKA